MMLQNIKKFNLDIDVKNEKIVSADILCEDGKIVKDGSPKEVAELYMKANNL